MRGHSQTQAERLEEDRQTFRPLPVVAFEAAIKSSRISTSLSWVRFADNDDSVPVAQAHRTLTVKGGCEEGVIQSGPQEIARHPRSWAKEQVCLEPVHYLALLERKPGALEKHRMGALRAAVEKGLSLGAITADAIAQFLLPQPVWRQTQFCLDGHPHWRGVQIDAPDLEAYRDLLVMGGAA